MARPSDPAARAALVLHPDDQVATALRDLAAGELVEVARGDETLEVRLVEPIRLCHKFALADLAPGTGVRKYGEVIGALTAAVPAGGWVHVHNLRSLRARLRARA
jgi:hypothetical protein